MKNVISAGSLWRDRGGATYLEFTFVFPLLMLTAFCTADFALVMFDWAQANKAVQNGARVAVVAAPVAQGLNEPVYEIADLGDLCVNPTTGEPVAGKCDAVVTRCVSTAVNCSEVGYADYPFDPDAFATIFQAMDRVFPRLEPENVRISYRSTGLGFVGRPGGLPMEVTVEIRCMSHQMFFLGALAGWAFQPRDGCPNTDTGVPIPSFATTLITESLGS